jgi:hypothetical protein
MHMTATGWARNMGPWQLLNQSLADAKVTSGNSSHYVNMNTASIHVNHDNGIQIGWGQNLTLGGQFRILVKFTKDEIIQLFKLTVGETLSPEVITETGLAIDDAVVRDRMRAMTVAQLIDLMTSQSASEADNAGQVDTSGDEQSEAAE